MNEDLEEMVLIDNTEKAKNEFGYNYGSEVQLISKKTLQEFLDANGNKLIATDINCGEYTLFIRLED